MEESLSWEIRETSINTVFGPAPYLDALLKFETHPHYFFLGTMLERMTKGVDALPDALMQAVTEFSGASDFLVEVFGEKGRHARLALGAFELPLHAPIELELIVQVSSSEV